MTLRQRHTEGAILYEKKLKPFMKNMNDGKGETPVYTVVMCFLQICVIAYLFNSHSAYRVQRPVQHLLPPHHSRPVLVGAGHGCWGRAGALGERRGGSRCGHVSPRGSSHHRSSRGDL